MQHAPTTRRGFLTGGASPASVGFYPPGVTEEALGNCSGCGACAEICPTNIISIRHGIPIVDLAQGECTFCGKCAERCPERVFPPEPVSNFFHHAQIGDDCLAENYVDCQACRDVCPPGAIRFRPRLGGPFVPVLDADECTGCGACLSVCPSQSISMTTRTNEVTHA